MESNSKNTIDLVVMWVDCTDEKWQEEFNKYNHEENNLHLFRDWDLMRYWFRGVEKNLTWINKIHFITWGHIPSWLNTTNPKLNIVNHKDFIPEEYLPTFSANAIELNIFRIKELSEQFIYANDDFFFIGKMNESDYFQNGLPCEYLHVTPITESKSKKFKHLLLNDISCINRNFDIHESANNNYDKWFSPLYSQKMIDDNKNALAWRNFFGFEYDHMPIPLLKSNIKEIYEKETDLFNEVFSRKIRDFNEDINIFMCRFWNLAKGQFVPYMRDKGKYCLISASEDVLRETVSNKNKIICLNDTEDDIDYENRKELLKELFESLLPEKSTFEK